jgi:hypothetical protein
MNKFGHNDQKSTSGVSIQDFKTNLLAFATEATTAGATPVILTSLTRRNFDNATGRVIENLADVTAAARSVAQSNNLPWIDLNAASLKYVNAIGKAAASRYNLESGDWTHLNEWGGVVFARIVSDLLVRMDGRFGEVTVKNETLSELIAQGKPA